ncbi:MAG: ABC transporter permease, partial [Lysobacterales bacterium]
MNVNAASARPRRIVRKRLSALAVKETLQAVRDPSTILIAFVLPIILLLLFAFAVSLDVRDVRLGLVLESDSKAAHSLAAAFSGTRYFRVTPARNRQEINPQLVSGKLHGMVVIPQDFDQRLANPGRRALVQIVTDGTQPNTANFVAAYAEGVIRGWASGPRQGETPLQLVPRFWYNPEVESRRFLIPGAIAIIMTMIGTLLTAMVVAREWERGTMEAIMSTPVSILEILIGKLLPYFGLGLVATLFCAVASITFFDVPLRGSWLALMTLSAVF